MALLAHQVAEEMEAAALHTIRARWCRQREPTGADDDADGATPRCARSKTKQSNPQVLRPEDTLLEFHAGTKGNTYRSFNPRPTDRPLSHIPFLVRPGKLPLLRDLSFLFRSASSPPPLFAAAFSCALLLASRSYMMIAPAVATL